MKYFAKPVDAPAVKFKNAEYLGLGLAAIFVIITVAQLFTFEDFIVIIEKSLTPVSVFLAAIAPPLLVVSGVFFLPFLLRMRISIAFRWLSMILGWVSSALWLFLAVRSFYDDSSFAILGSVVSVPGGIVSLVAAILLSAGVAVCSYALWPGAKRQSR